MDAAKPQATSFEEAIKQSKAPRSILLGNGFSIAQAGGQFSYSSLLDRCGLPAESPIRNVFRTLHTVDFERVMEALNHAAQISDAYGDDEQAAIYRGDVVSVREALIHGVHEVHPGIQFDIPAQQRKACAAFLNNFECIFTLNYDLLMYWVILNNPENQHSDGFGLGPEVNGFRTFSEDGHCNTYYLHGALHLFLGSKRETLKRVVTGGTIVNDIAATIRNTGHLPLFVAEGTTIEKMARINSVPYLRVAYDHLCSNSGSLFIFGHSVGANDAHIHDAIFDSEVKQVFFCVHQPQNDWSGIRERLAPYRERNPDVALHYVDAASAHVWGNSH